MVALRHEDRRRRRAREEQPPSSFEIKADEPALSALFDRTWAQSVMGQAADRQSEYAAERGEAPQRRLELLALRFQDGLPIREIAIRWNVEPAHLHREYARARREFHEALIEVVAFHHPGAPEDVEAECERMLEVLSSQIPNDVRHDLMPRPVPQTTCGDRLRHECRFAQPDRVYVGDGP